MPPLLTGPNIPPNLYESLPTLVPILPACTLVALLLWLPTKKETLQIAGWAQIAASLAFSLLLSTPLGGKTETFLAITFFGLGLLCLLTCPYKKREKEL
jgi:hypothetical protein